MSPKTRAAAATLLALLAASAPLAAQSSRITIPAVASIVGASPFYSDVRVFNTSYTASAGVTATYRCFIGACPAAAQQTFTLSPRESRAFDNMVVSAFAAPNSAGGVEFDVAPPATASDVVVTSRLYSTAPTPTVGMFIPGVDASAAHRYSVLTQISNGGSGAGFRTNVGAFNGQDTAATVVFAVYWEGHWVGEVERTIPAHSGVQVNNVFGPGGINHALLETSDAVVTVQTNGPAVFGYAAVIDNATTDPIFVAGAEDVAPVLSVGGVFSTQVSLVPGQNTCGNVNVQNNPDDRGPGAGLARADADPRGHHVRRDGGRRRKLLDAAEERGRPVHDHHPGPVHAPGLFGAGARGSGGAGVLLPGGLGRAEGRRRELLSIGVRSSFFGFPFERRSSPGGPEIRKMKT